MVLYPQSTPSQMNLPSSFRREMESAEGFFAMTDEDGAEEEDEDGGA